VVYGIVGIAIFVAVAVGVARPLERARQLSESVDNERAALVNSLDQAETTIRAMGTSVTNMNTSLGDAKIAIDRASTISDGVATSMFSLRDAMSLEIPLVGQPLLGLASSFDTSGQNLQLLSGDISAIGTALDANRADVTTTASSLNDLADSVGELTDSVNEGPSVAISTRTLDSIRLAIYAVTGWLVAFAIGCVLIGLYLINASRRRALPVASD